MTRLGPIMRDPALLGAVVLALLQVLDVLWLHLDTDQLTLVNAVAVTVVGFTVAAVVRSDHWVPALLGLVKAAGALVVGFGLDWSPESQAAVMTLAVVVSALVVRTQVTAPIPPAVRVEPAVRR